MIRGTSVAFCVPEIATANRDTYATGQNKAKPLFVAPFGRQRNLSIDKHPLFAALLVVLYHSLFLFIPSLDRPGMLRNIVTVGWVSVDLFFVLSGYILGVVYVASQPTPRISIRTFVIARFARVYPLYALSLMADLPFALMKRFEPGVTVHTIGLFGVQVATYGLMVQAWLPGISNGWNIPSWSLSAEAFFYLLFPFVALQMWNSRHPVYLTAGLWLIAAVVPLANHHVLHNASLESLFPWNPLLELPEFLMGIIAAGQVHRIPPRLALHLAVLSGGMLAAIFLLYVSVM